MVIEHKMCVLIFSPTLSKPFLCLRRIQQGIIVKVHRLHVKYLIFLSDFNETEIFWTDCHNTHKTQDSIKILPVAAKLFNVGGQAGRHGEANSNFLQFCERT
jgi:hypothetical protein